MFTYYLLAAGAALLFFGVYFLLEKTIKASEEKKSWISKGFSLALAAIFAVRYLAGDVALETTRGLNINSPFGKDGGAIVLMVLSLLLIWATYAVNTLLVTYPFFNKKIRLLTPLVKIFAGITLLFDFALLFLVFRLFDEGATLQKCAFCVELGLSMAITAVCWRKNPKTSFSKSRVKITILALVAMFLSAMPVYAPQVLFDVGTGAVVLKDFTFAHRLALYGAFVVPTIIVVSLSKFDYEHKRYALLFVSLATMVSYSYNYSFATFTDMSAWPLHLCNTAMFIIPFCLIFKVNKVFYFTLFINVLGAFFAMFLPNYSDGVTWRSVRCVHFWLNHYCAFFMPVVIIALGLYERPKMKQFLYSLIGFGAYFAFVLFANAWLTNWHESVDFFFINSDFIADKLGQWAKNLRLVTLKINVREGIVMIFYPVYQALYFLVYVLLSFAMWFLYELCFQVADLYVDIWHRNKKIKVDRLALEVHMAGRNATEPLNMEASNKLILKNFSKKYASSDTYAVKEANLEIEGGQIFGFLGPNGAGKSTIIKSIVGIQSITSGSIEVCGYDVERQSVGAKLQTGFVPDHYALYENLTGREYVNYIADLYDVSKEDRTARIEEYVERFRLTGSFDNPIKTYSHGMKQKITIMSALVHDPKLWILDEPLTGLDPESIFQVKEAMKEHAAKGNIVFFSSHIIDVVERICDRIAIIKKGNILCCKTVEEIEAQGVALEDFYMNMIDGLPLPEAAAKEENVHA